MAPEVRCRNYDEKVAARHLTTTRELGGLKSGVRRFGSLQISMVSASQVSGVGLGFGAMGEAQAPEGSCRRGFGVQPQLIMVLQHELKKPS